MTEAGSSREIGFVSGYGSRSYGNVKYMYLSRGRRGVHARQASMAGAKSKVKLANPEKDRK